MDVLNAVLPEAARWSHFSVEGVEIFESSRIDDAEFLQQELPAMQGLARSHGFNLVQVDYSLADSEPRLSDLAKELAEAAATSAPVIFDDWEAERLSGRSGSSQEMKPPRVPT